MRGMRKLTATGISRLATLLAGGAVLAFGVDAAAGQTSKRFVRTYDARIVLSVTTTAPDSLFVEKATHTYRRVRILFIIETSGWVRAIPADYATEPANGVMSGEVTYQKTGSVPCTDSKRFSGPARMAISASRSVSASGQWAGSPGGAELNRGSKRKCPDVIDFGGGHVWEYTKGRIIAQASSVYGQFGWVLTAPPIRGRLPYPLDRLYAGKSFVATASGTTNDGFAVRNGSIRVTFTARP